MALKCILAHTLYPTHMHTNTFSQMNKNKECLNENDLNGMNNKRAQYNLVGR